MTFKVALQLAEEWLNAYNIMSSERGFAEEPDSDEAFALLSNIIQENSMLKEELELERQMLKAAVKKEHDRIYVNRGEVDEGDFYDKPGEDK